MTLEQNKRVVEWQNRYPDIQFFLSFFPHKKNKIPSSRNFEKWFQNQDLTRTEVLYIIGLIDISPLDWLKEKKERALVFVEDDLGAFASFTNKELLDNPQIHFVYAQDDVISTLAETFPTEYLTVYEGKPFNTNRLKKEASSLSALFSDILYSHPIVENVLTNYLRLPHSFDGRKPFGKVPAIICGGGPSLERVMPHLKKLQDKALIIGGGSSIVALTKGQAGPHLAMALDPNPHEFELLCEADPIACPLLFAPRLNYRVFQLARGPSGYLKTDTGGLIESWLEEKLQIEGPTIGPELGNDAFSVTTLALAYAVYLGCDPIIFAGVDLARSGDQHYAKGINTPPDTPAHGALDQPLVHEGHSTCLKWVMESECISAFAKKHPHIRFFNTSGGLGFKGIEQIDLQFLDSFPSRDLSGEIQKWMLESPMNISKEAIVDLIETLKASLQRCKSIIEKLHVSPTDPLLELELKEEPAYQALLEGIDKALSRILFRYFPTLDQEEGKKNVSKAKYQELLKQVERLEKIAPLS